jgi:hypothetical protein
MADSKEGSVPTGIKIILKKISNYLFLWVMVRD